MSEPAKDEAELIEWMAQAIHDSVYRGQSAWKDIGRIERSYREMEADAAIAAIRAAGWAVVPVEPTEAMLWAADRAPAPTWEMDNPDHAEFVLFAVRRAEWIAMIKSAPRVKP